MGLRAAHKRGHCGDAKKTHASISDQQVTDPLLSKSLQETEQLSEKTKHRNLLQNNKKVELIIDGLKQKN